MAGFGCWFGLLSYLQEHNNIVYYHAPLDTVPCMVTVTKVFKNGKLRIAAGPYSFTADRSHLERFRYRAES